MKVKIKKKGLEPGKRLDLKKGDTWSLWDGDTLLEEKVPVPDAGLSLNHYKCIVNDGGTVSVVRFADLHRHSDNSLRDGILKIPDMVKYTEYAGALTDHGNLYGFVEYYNTMKAAGKKPIIGMEAYQENLQGELSRNHLILLAKNDVGYKNLIKLSSESFEHFYRKPHITWEMLNQYHEGIICTTACLGGLIPKSFANGDRESAYYAAKQLLNIFGEDFYIEIQRHGIKDEELVNPQLLGLARELNIPIVATTDSHYLRKEDAYAHEVMMCLEQDLTIDMPHRRYEGTGYHLHSSEEMEQLFSDLPEALDNTLRIADKCDVIVKMGDVNLPNYEIPAPFATPLEYFKHICKTGFDERFQGKPQHEDPVYLERYDYEMSVIEKMGFETYFLIVWDFINYARSVNVYIGPGRGSAAGSLLAFCMGITDMDPIRFNLLFERFLNPERVSWPDIDTDIEHVGRQKVIDYITKKYGAESVCRIVTFGTMAAKMVIKDVARVMGYPPAWANNLAKLVPNAPKITLTSAFEMNPELRRRYNEESDVARVIDVAKTLEGCKRHASQHACFEAGTPVLTVDGEIPIEEVRRGDMVMTHEGRFQRVADTMVTYTKEVYDVCVGDRIVTVTGNHPFLTDSGQWVPVCNLNKNVDRIICRVGKSFYALPFEKTKRDVKEQSMYNLTVENDSSYIAGSIVAHNCGLVVAPGKVENFLPTSMEKGEGGEKSLTSQVVMTEVELLSLLKMDLLGLKNLSAIHEVMNTVKRTRGVDMKYQDLPLDDRDTYRMLAKGLTGGVFQLESTGMTDVIRQMLGDINTLPDERMGECFERLIAAVALYRPGPMDYIPDYIKGMMDSSNIHYDCKQEEDILSSTYGVMVYQEQLMHIAQTLAGYSLGEADLLRKACAKKKKDVMAKEHARFVYGNKEDFDAGKAKHLIPGCVGNGISPEIAEEIWNKMEKFASYAFNRSHAACYAWIASITAYMACHWPAEFFCAMLNAFEDISDKVKNYLAIAARRGIKLLPPDINKSMDKCTVEGDCIRLGFHALSGLNKLSRAIAQVRKTGEFQNYQEFYERMSTSDKLNKKALESLINSGALDCFGMNRRQMTEMIPTLEKNFKSEAKDRALNQISLFTEEQRRIQPPEVPEYDEKILMEKELRAIGFYLSNHPVNAILSKVKNPGSYTPISDLAILETPQRQVMILALISDMKLIYTKKEEEMYLFSLEDQFNSIRCVLFPSRVAANKHRLVEGAVVKAVGEFAVDEDHGKQIIVNDLMGEDEILAEKSNSVTVTIRNKAEQEQLLDFVKKNPGNSGVVLLANGRSYPIAPKIRVTPETLDYLRSNFSHISA